MFYNLEIIYWVIEKQGLCSLLFHSTIGYMWKVSKVEKNFLYYMMKGSTIHIWEVKRSTVDSGSIGRSCMMDGKVSDQGNENWERLKGGCDQQQRKVSFLQQSWEVGWSWPCGIFITFHMVCRESFLWVKGCRVKHSS